MCFQIFEESKKSYEILFENIPLLPSAKEIETNLRLATKQFSENVSDLDKIATIISDFKQKFQINNVTKVYGSLAVDALFFKPDMRILKEGEATGMISTCNVGRKHITYFPEI
ncbi:hypothetical protein M9Y10_026256 [Tritrichomonas musculus]|uniref:Uncharacterized protein n=1 Tax=Tritrichomonas musculus TaxID=1915356 RepID=A0ABR2H730_9EUKA